MSAEQIAEVIRAHQPTTGMSVASGVTCRCGYWNGNERAGVDRPPGYQGLQWHQAQELSAAGFGLVADAKAEALEEAADHLARLEYVRPDHPNRAAYEKILAVRRGNTDAWLKARAGLIRAAS